MSNAFTNADIPPPPTRNEKRIHPRPGREDPVATSRAEMDAAPAPRLQRRRKSTENPFDLDDGILADAKARGVTLEWKRYSCFNRPDTRHMVALRDNHWSPVPAKMYPDMMPPDQQGGNIEHDGMILMERPAYLTEEARQEDYANAREAVQIKEAQMGHTPDGTLTRNHPTAKPRISKSYAPLTVPKE